MKNLSTAFDKFLTLNRMLLEVNQLNFNELYGATLGGMQHIFIYGFGLFGIFVSVSNLCCIFCPINQPLGVMEVELPGI